MPVRPRILVVEDDEDLRELLRLCLEMDGFSVSTSANGKEALDAVRRERPDAIVLDMWMPVMNGWRFCRELEARGERTAPILVMTAAAGAERLAAEVDADAWLGKPFEPPVLSEKLRGLVDGEAVTREA